jgi:hypothetical protein
MCLGAIIWSNIKTVYFGCQPNDADQIGFRDAFIYQFMNSPCQDPSVLHLEEFDRDSCLTLFEEYQKKQFQQTAIIKEAPGEYTTPGGIIVPGSTTTDTKSSGTVDFEQWADQKLTTQVSGTKQPIDLDAVKKDPAVKTELDKVLPQIKKDPANIAAVEQYFLTAMQGMQRMAAQARQSAGIDPNATVAGTNPLSKIINDQQLGAIKNLAQNPQTAAVIKQTLGIK